jgi:CRISPR system Cascade subunit CasB
MPEPHQTDWAAEVRFIKALEGLQTRADRAALAALRRVIGHQVGDVPEADRRLVPLLPPGLSDGAAATWYLVAGLFASHPLSWRPRAGPTGRSLGASLARLQDARGPGGGLEARFVGLLSANTEDLPEHLRRALQLLKGGGIGVDWTQFLSDLLAWDHEDRVVQRRWARAFWGQSPTPTTPDTVSADDDDRTTVRMEDEHAD